MTHADANFRWAYALVDELARSGLRAVCIAPGSRSTPLTLAFAKQPEIAIYSHIDERSAAFFALGVAMASREPVALVCTSGTAAANFFPAIIEAHQSRIPLIVLTADRPHELRHSGANQTIDQVKIYGDYALWAVDAALPEVEPPPAALRNLRTLAARAFATANGARKGVVHINLPFRKPLQPAPDSALYEDPARDNGGSKSAPHTTITRAPLAPDDQQMAGLADIINTHERGLIVCGPNVAADAQYAQAVTALSARVAYPILADPASGARFGLPEALGGYETYFARGANAADYPDVVLRVGAPPTSKWLNQFLVDAAPQHHVHIVRDGVWGDDSHLLTHVIHADETLALQRLQEIAAPRPDSRWRDAFAARESTHWTTIKDSVNTGPYFDGAVVFDVVDLIPEDGALFVGNSLPIRHLDQFGQPGGKRINVFANRGASGIDGNISTALGAGAAAPEKPLVMIIGDVTFMHDMNGLLAIQRCKVPATIVLLNNNGGGIFHRLPVNAFDPPFTDLFITPHGLDFQHAAAALRRRLPGYTIGGPSSETPSPPAYPATAPGLLKCRQTHTKTYAAGTPLSLRS